MRIFCLLFLFNFFFSQTILHSQTNNDTIISKTYLFIGLKGDYFSSKSSAPGGIPLKLNNPVITANTAAFYAGYKIINPNITHEFAIDFVFPSGQKLDDGLGNDFVLNEEKSRYFFIDINYHFTKRLFSIGNFNFRWGAAANVLYEETGLSYLYGAEMKRWDITPHLGPVFSVDYKILNVFTLYCNIRSLITFGLINIGRYSFNNPENNLSDSYSYHATAFYSIFQTGIKYDLNDNAIIEAGYFRNGNINIAARQIFPSDYQNSLNKIYRNEGFFINYYLNTESLW